MGLLAIYCLFTRRTYAAGVIVAFGWFEYFTTNLGFVLDTGKLFGILCFGYLLLTPDTFRNPGVRLLIRRWSPYFIYCVAITVVFAPFWPEAESGAQQILYSSLRWLVR